MSTTVIIPTFQGREKLPRVMTALQAQTVKDFELIVVVDGSTDNSQDWLRSQSSRFSRLKIVEQPNKGRAAARNQGAKSASGDVLIFYDDDMVPGSNSVERHLQLHREHSEILLGGNQVEYPSAAKTDIQNYKAWLSEGWLKKYPPGVTQLTSKNLFFTAANCSMRKSVFQKLNGFDERLTDAEDFDLACRALENGLDVYFDKNNLAVHNDTIDCISYIVRLRQYRIAHLKLSQLHPLRQRSPQVTGGPLKKIIYRLFAVGKLPYYIDRHAVLAFLPKKLRYKLYGVIIYALAYVCPNVPVKR